MILTINNIWQHNINNKHNNNLIVNSHNHNFHINVINYNKYIQHNNNYHFNNKDKIIIKDSLKYHIKNLIFY